MCVRSLARQQRFNGDTCASGLVVVLDVTNTIVSRACARAPHMRTIVTEHVRNHQLQRRASLLAIARRERALTRA